MAVEDGNVHSDCSGQDKPPCHLDSSVKSYSNNSQDDCNVASVLIQSKTVTSGCLIFRLSLFPIARSCQTVHWIAFFPFLLFYCFSPNPLEIKGWLTFDLLSDVWLQINCCGLWDPQGHHILICVHSVLCTYIYRCTFAARCTP